MRYVPFRLLDCLGLGAPSGAVAFDCLRGAGAFLVMLLVVVLELCRRAFLATGGWSSLGLGGGLGLARKKTEGEGM